VSEPTDPSAPRDPIYDGVLERTADGGTIRFERRLPYDVRAVWSAITDPERLAEWWLPFVADVTVDLREGGELRFVGRGEEEIDMRCTILRVEAPMLLEHTHPAPGSRMRWELEPTDAGCTLRLSHHVPDASEAVDNCYVVGLHASLARLGPCLAGAPVAWDWEAFAAAQAAYARDGLAPEVEAS
jgi:uncharacterized protein YndB with AHSA1/START domain